MTAAVQGRHGQKRVSIEATCAELEVALRTMETPEPPLVPGPLQAPRSAQLLGGLLSPSFLLGALDVILHP